MYFTTDAGNDIQITSGTALASTYSAGDGLDLTGPTFSTDLKANGGLAIESTELAVDLGASSITGTLAVGDGGSGQTSYTNGQLLIGNTTGNTLAKATLTASTGISITNGTGTVTIASNLEGTELISTGETGGSKFLREDGDGTCSWQTAGGGGSGDVEAGSTFTTAGVIMACDGDDKTIDEPTALLTTNGQGMTVSAALATPFQVDNSTRDGNATFKFTTGSAAGTDNQASLQVIAQTAANANLNLGDTASATKGGLKYKNSGDSMQLIAAGAAVLELDSDKVVEFKIAEEDDASGTDYSYASKALKIKVNGTDYWLQLYEEAGGGGGGGGMGGP